MAAVIKYDHDEYTCRVRRASLDDVEGIMGIESLSFSSPWPRSAFVGEIKAHSWSNVFVAEIDGRIVGFMVYWSVVGEIHLLNLAVHPSMRRQGIGARLVDYLIETSKDQGHEEIVLEARVSNQGARKLYEEFGFEDLLIRRGYYADNGEDAVVMKLTLKPQNE